MTRSVAVPAAGPARAEIAVPAGRPARAEFAAIGTTAVVLVTDVAALGTAQRLLHADLAELDLACSRFRPDSEALQLAARAGRWQPVSPLLADAINVALRAARLTRGLVDPTVVVAALGYDRDFASVPADDPRPAGPAEPAPGWWRVRFDPARRQVLLPRGVALDLGATAKALAADRAARRIAATTGSGVLVSLGGDLAVAGPVPEGGWLVGTGDRDPSESPAVVIRSGGLATSSTGRRAWRRGGHARHHIVDPRTGQSAAPVWRTASIAAGTCVDANTASTAAIVLGHAAPAWLERHGLPARLVRCDGSALLVGGWPNEGAARRAPAGRSDHRPGERDHQAGEGDQRERDR